jgi:hypothetical protein
VLKITRPTVVLMILLLDVLDLGVQHVLVVARAVRSCSSPV